ncbi:glycosyltransferase [Alkalilacustris brevis]|uniref:glycosyltransferase n=1 Tax=Alkalilacustris brevis TaxID=2026338 RepID=UPI001EE40076|nr:glycosyltransferase [Alkalilacustris brevis]
MAILLAVYNGAALLEEQLASYLAQHHADWSLIVSDDGSSDTSRQIVQRFAARAAGRAVRLRAGPRAGFASNFLALLQAAGPDAPFAALSDQDDVWLPAKLERALAALAGLPPCLPALYCSRSLISDAKLGARRPSCRLRRAPGFANALVQNIASGNTIVLNRAALDLVQAAGTDLRDAPVAHDWWIYQIVTGAGGAVVHDDRPGLLYRQHANNLIGANDGLRARLCRIAQLLRGDYRAWNDRNLAALEASRHRLTPGNRALLARFAQARRSPLPRRLRLLRGSGVYRQGRAGNALLWFAALTGHL